jgi:small subunit ribosomal protein S3Ae
MAEAATTKKKIAKGKIWFKIHAPSAFNENEIGETLGNDETSLKGRLIDVYLSDITGDMTKHNVKLGLRIVDAKGQHAYTEIVDYGLVKQYLSRLFRRYTSKIEVVTDVVLKDGKKFRIKGLAVTAYKANRGQQSAIHTALKKELTKRIPEFDMPGLVNALSTSGIQREIAMGMQKIFPIKAVEVRKVEPIKAKKERKKKKEEKAEVEEEAPGIEETPEELEGAEPVPETDEQLNL